MNYLIIQILPVTNMIAYPMITIDSPRHTYVVFANTNPVAITIENWGTSFTRSVLLNLVEIGKYNSLMRYNSERSWSRPKVYEDQTRAVSILCSTLFFWIILFIIGINFICFSLAGEFASRSLRYIPIIAGVYSESK